MRATPWRSYLPTVREVCLEDATPVEFGTVLFYIEPHATLGAVGPESA